MVVFIYVIIIIFFRYVIFELDGLESIMEKLEIVMEYFYVIFFDEKYD